MLSDRCFIIAEAGTCHADPDPIVRFRRAISYVHAAKKAGANAVKFQWFLGGSLFCPYEGDDKRIPRWKNSVLGIDQWMQIKEHAEACGLVFLASAFEDQTVGWLKQLGMVASKVASRAAKNFPYSEAPAPYLVSNGMYPVPAEIPGDVFVFECEARYPSTAIWKGDHPGFSDHSGNPWRAIDAISRGCKFIEVHYCIDTVDAGPDLPASLNLEELSLICRARDAFAELKQLEKI